MLKDVGTLPFAKVCRAMHGFILSLLFASECYQVSKNLFGYKVSGTDKATSQLPRIFEILTF